MPKRSSKRQETDPNRRAYLTMLRATGQEPLDERPTKNPAAVALGRLGGAKGGRARAEKLSARRRKEIARKAAIARWTKRTLAKQNAGNYSTSTENETPVKGFN